MQNKHEAKRALPVRKLVVAALLLLVCTVLPTACGPAGGLGDLDSNSANAAGGRCMLCHNGSNQGDYAGPGIEDPHPFPGASNMDCAVCHGGNPDGRTKEEAHVPPPPTIGDRENWEDDRHAYFNRLTLTGLDQLEDYEGPDGTTYTALDYLQWVNPGDLRVVTEGRSCGECHQGHAECSEKSLLATGAGILSGAAFAIGVDHRIPGTEGLYEETGSDQGFRAVDHPGFSHDPDVVGPVQELMEYPVFSVRGQSGDGLLFRNDDEFAAAGLADDFDAEGRVITDSPLAKLFHEQVAFTCGDCHLGSAGANNRSGDYRGSGCTSCHMPYALDGRGRHSDPNLNREEPLDPDDIDEGELPHLRAHRILSVAKTMSNGVQQQGIDDYACAGCHQGSNRTVMQYWGIRLDQNQDLRRRVQYPANPVDWEGTRNDQRLFPDEYENREFNGRNHNQYILFEDYDGDERDDTPADVHHEAGMGCIDCHGSFDLHGGDVRSPGTQPIMSRMEQAVSVRCESCHGSVSDYAQTTPGVDYQGQTRDLVTDINGNVLRHVERNAEGEVWLTSRLTGERHYVIQTKDTVVDSGQIDPRDGEPLYSPKASYAMGRDDGDAATGTGPTQGDGSVHSGFSHADDMSCASCHAAWTNSCIGCHLWGEYDENNNFSNITGERIVFEEDEADFVYQSPVMFQLGVGPNGTIEQVSPNTKTFFRWEDRQNNISEIFSFSDRQGRGADTATGAPSLGCNAMLAHSIRGKVDDQNEGPRYCVACHLTEEGLEDYGAIYDTFRTRMATDDFANLDFEMLQTHIGLNPGNTMNSPMWVHMVAGLGSGLFLFDDQGFPVNPLDNDRNRKGREDNMSPADIYDPNRAFHNLDRIVLPDGRATSSSNHMLLHGPPLPGQSLRDGAENETMAGPLGSRLLRRLTDPVTGIVLDGWIDADGNLVRTATTNVR
ncbi:MAG: hypothetical protein AAF196_20815 [Planctomycetota bacterium]